MTMRITITEINSQNKMDLPLHDQPYEVIGRMKLRYDGQWSYTEELTERPFSKTFPEEDDERDEFITAEHKTAFLAYADQVCVGDIRLRCDWNRYAFIENIGVAPEMRGCGIGTALLQAAERWAIGKGMKGFALEMQDTNLYAAQFYQRSGFSIGGINTRYYTNFGNDEIAVFWYKSFQSPEKEDQA